jgi:hypothetical protein
MCGRAGATKNTTEPLGRLLFVDTDCWVHAGCAEWSGETYDDEHGVLFSVRTAINRGKVMRCFGCNDRGATVGCRHRHCRKNYHFPCAVQVAFIFTDTRHTYCAQHDEAARADGAFVPEARLMPAQCRVAAVDAAREDETRGLLRAQDTRAALWMAADAYGVPRPELPGAPPEAGAAPLLRRVGALTVHCVGRVLPNCPGYHTPRAIYAVGYRATRLYWYAAGQEVKYRVARRPCPCMV